VCSSRCETPILGRGSCALAVRTQTPIATDRTLGSRSLSTVMPLGAAVRWISRSSRTVSSVWGTLVLLDQRFPREPHPAALVHLEQLHPEVVALLHDILRLLGAAVLQLGDVQQSFDAGDDLDERAERGGALHHALVDPADFRLLHEPGYHVSRSLRRLAHARNRDHTRVLYVDLGAGLLLNTADRLALGPDEVADFIGTDLNRDDARSVLGELRPRLGHRLMHDVQDTQARMLGLFERFADDLPVELLDLDVHLDRCHAVLRPSDLEIHVAEVILGAQNIGEDRGPFAVGNQAHRDACARRLYRYAGVHQRERPRADRGHGRRAVRLEDFRHDAARIRELLIRPQHR